MTIVINIPGEPVAKGRARSFIKKNGAIGHHTPKKTANWETIAKWRAQQAMNDRNPLHGPVRLRAVLTFKIPDSWPLWKKEAARNGFIAHTVKPDASNVLKAIEDAFNEVVFADDAQIIDPHPVKRYGDQPGVTVEISEIEGLAPSQIKRKTDLKAA